MRQGGREEKNERILLDILYMKSRILIEARKNCNQNNWLKFKNITEKFLYKNVPSWIFNQQHLHTIADPKAYL